MPKVIAGLVFILVVAYVVANPSQAADMVHGGWSHTQAIGHSLGEFVNRLAG